MLRSGIRSPGLVQLKGRNTMTADLLEREYTSTSTVATGAVIEFDIEGDAFTALVLLATPEAVILDACDGSLPFVLRPDELGSFRVFDGDLD
jgi:hypothetical protein